tara:strand:- start:3969 stop:4202 length:234 start_codon:yes stop_codon:yes gene_type:complete
MVEYDPNTEKFIQPPPRYKGISTWRDEECATEDNYGYEGKDEELLYPDDNRCIEDSSEEVRRRSLVKILGKQGLLSE